MSHAATYAQTVTRLARDYRNALDDNTMCQEVREPILNQLFDMAHAVGISSKDAVNDLFDEIEAGPVNAA